ncbi:unnamed protein product [Pneumocystis jirovecii]|uniref:Uncharacterized protein n=1 Tax=Pneumocystis jirovecii TaxID=42068 RepID=L0PHX4_PNEJI|nr:unnamed protein product [Pneumocystis jirovecii]
MAPEIGGISRNCATKYDSELLYCILNRLCKLAISDFTLLISCKFDHYNYFQKVPIILCPSGEISNTSTAFRREYASEISFIIFISVTSSNPGYFLSEDNLDVSKTLIIVLRNCSCPCLNE